MTSVWRSQRLILTCGFLSALGLSHTAFGDCEHTIPRSAEIDAVGARRVMIDVGAGDLVVTGTQGATRVLAKGEACAESTKLLDAVRIDTRRDGDTIYVKTVLPASDSWMNSTSLDLKIELPASVAVELDDSSGDIELRNVAAAKVSDSSGDQSIREVDGDLSVDDSSGDIDIQTIRGNVSVRDSSGDVRVSDVNGSVTIPVDSSGGLSLRRVRGDVHILSDSSGDIVIADVNQNVLIDNDSSGDIRVSDIGGNFTVSHDSTGDLTHRHVLGSVNIPRKDD
jgi:hypothetical protein